MQNTLTQTNESLHAENHIPKPFYIWNTSDYKAQNSEVSGHITLMLGKKQIRETE